MNQGMDEEVSKDLRVQQQVEQEYDEYAYEEDLEFNLNKFGDAVIWNTDWTAETIARQLKKNTIDLSPNFQRRDAWTDKEKSKLIESLFLGIPVPPIILAENKKKKNSYIVIDGKQRLLSIRRFYSTSTEEDGGFKPLKLSGLDVLRELNGYSYEGLCEKRPDFLSAIDNQPIRTVIIKNWPDETFLYTVFLRLNTGSKKLSPQELRQALIPGPFLDYLDQITGDSLLMRKVLKNSGPDSRMRDIELALRFLAFRHYIERYDGNLKRFLDDTCVFINEDWIHMENTIETDFRELEDSLKFVYEIGLDNKEPFSRWINGEFNNRFNKSIYELFTYHFSSQKIRELVSSQNQYFLELFKELNENQEFIASISDTTKDIRKVAARFDLFWKILTKLHADKKFNAKHIVIKNDKIVVQVDTLG